MYYSEPLYRPPSEAYSAIIQATIGCSHNKCAFCSMYKSKAFSILPWDELKKHIDSIAQHYKSTKKIFIADGNALVMPTGHWLKLLSYLKEVFPYAEQISAYATPKDLLRKTPEDLKAIREKGLSLLYMGIESGNDEILKYINKGATSEEIISAGKKAIAAGFKLSVTIIAGLGGKKYKEHAKDTAEVINAIQPHYIGMLSLMLEPGTVLYKEFQEGKFTLPLPVDYLQETKIFLENVRLQASVFRSNHASNYLSLSGTLNTDKDKLLQTINYALAHPSLLKPEHFRGL